MLTNLQSFKQTRSNEEGFTLIELMIVVVIIGLLAAIAIPIFANQQKAAIDAKSKSHIKQLQTAIEVARVKTSKPLVQITGNTCTYCRFNVGTTRLDPLELPNTHIGWETYNVTLDRISVASGMDVRGLLDGHGRPMVIDENEAETADACRQDLLGSMADPFTGSRSIEIKLSFATAGCFPLN